MTDEAARVYVLDANVLIEAHRRYYAFDLCPGFWTCLIHFCGVSRLLSVDRVRQEILDGDHLAAWVNTLPDRFFASTADASVIDAFRKMMNWVQEQEQFMDAAKEQFARVADGWLAAYASVHGGTVVTHETYNDKIRRKVPLPNVCRAFDVPYVDTFQMLRVLEVSFAWAA